MSCNIAHLVPRGQSSSPSLDQSPNRFNHLPVLLNGVFKRMPGSDMPCRFLADLPGDLLCHHKAGE